MWAVELVSTENALEQCKPFAHCIYKKRGLLIFLAPPPLLFLHQNQIIHWKGGKSNEYYPDFVQKI